MFAKYITHVRIYVYTHVCCKDRQYDTYIYIYTQHVCDTYIYTHVCYIYV